MVKIVKKLDEVQLDILWLKAQLLPTEKVSKKERAEIERAKKEIAKGQWISGDELIKQLSG